MLWRPLNMAMMWGFAAVSKRLIQPVLQVLQTILSFLENRLPAGRICRSVSAPCSTSHLLLPLRSKSRSHSPKTCCFVWLPRLPQNRHVPCCRTVRRSRSRLLGFRVCLVISAPLFARRAAASLPGTRRHCPSSCPALALAGTSPDDVGGAA